MKRILGPQMGPKLGFYLFLKVVSLGQCLPSSRAEISKKGFVAQIGTEMIFSILMLLSIHSDLLVF